MKMETQQCNVVLLQVPNSKNVDLELQVDVSRFIFNLPFLVLSTYAGW